MKGFAMQLLNIQQLAEIIHKSPLSVANDVTRNPSALPPFARISGRILFEKTLVDEWVRSKFNDHAHLNSVNKKRSAGRPRKHESEV